MDRTHRLVWSCTQCAVQDVSELPSTAHDVPTYASAGGASRVKRYTLSATFASVLAIAPSLLLAGALLPVNNAHADTFTVTTSAPNGAGSLSDAIAASNATPGANVIVFANGIASIDANATLPTVTNSVTFNSSENLSIAATLNANVPVTWSGRGTFTLAGSNDNLIGVTTIDDSTVQAGNGTSAINLNGAAGAAGSGATGGTAVVVNGGRFINSAASSVSGGNGGDGASGGYSGGTGGDGVLLTSGSVINDGGIAGGNGGSNGPPGSGFGGPGGNGVLMKAVGSLTNNGSINGGSGGPALVGGYGVYMTSGGSFVNNGSVAGGKAGSAFGVPPIYDPAGGDGVYVVGGSVINNGSITGAAGSFGGFFHSLLEGEGGAGITASSTIVNGTLVGATVINNGGISGGLSGYGDMRSAAIELAGGGNTLIIEAGSSITGDVVSCASVTNCITNGVGDTLALGGAVSSSFDVSRINTSFTSKNDTRYLGFSAYEKIGASVWVLTGTTTAVTPWVISQGTLSVSSDANLGASTGSLTFDGGALQTIADTASNRAVTLGNNGGIFDTNGHSLALNGTVSGVGSLTKTDSGSLILNGANTYTGGTTISSGTLEVGDSSHTSASIQGAVMVGSNGILRGHGIVGGDVTSDGIVWPGGSLGTLTIHGNYTQRADGSLQIDVTPTQASQLVVTGNANLAGTLNLIYAPGTYTASSTYTVIQAGSVTGRFTAVNAAGATPVLLSSKLDYTSTQANLVLAKLSIAPVDGSVYGNLLRSVNLVDQQTLSSVLDTALPSTATCDGRQQARESNVTRQACRGGVWVQATGSSLSLAGSNGLNTSDFGFLVGADRELGDVRVGVEAGVNRVNANDSLESYGDIDIAHAGLYGITHVGSLMLSANVDGAYDAYRIDRQTGIGHAVAEPSGRSVSGGLQAAWPVQALAWQLIPKFGVLYQHQQMDGFTETLVSNNPLAPAFALGGERSTYTSLQPYLALSVTRNFQFQGITYVPALSVGYRYDTRGDNSPTVSMAAQDGTRFAPTGTSVGRGSATAEARITAEAGASWNFYLDYQGLFANGLHDNALTLGLVKHL